MLDELREQIDVAREQLQHLIDVHRPLLEKCATEQPSPFEVSALAAMLHSFYGGIENVFKRIALEADDSMPMGGSWHRQLLEQMARPQGDRPPVISEALKNRLAECLRFRHFFRQGYVFQLRWSRMEDLISTSEQTLRQFFDEIDRFLAEQT